MTLRTSIFAGAAALAALAAPATAQTVCGGLPSGIWIGGTEGNSDIATADSFREQLALVLLDNAHLSMFRLSEPAEVRLEAQGRGAGDPVIDILDETGASVGTDDDSGGGTSSAALLSLGPGTYCLRTSSFGNAPLTATVRIGLPEHEALTDGGARLTGAALPQPVDPVEPVDPVPPATTTDLSDTTVTTEPPPLDASGPCGGGQPLADGPVNARLEGGISAENPIDTVPIYYFDLDAPATVTLTAENLAADPVLTLTGEDGTFYAENDDYDGLNSRVEIVDPLQPGRYCVGLRAIGDGSVPVTVTLAAFDSNAALVDAYETGEQPPPLDGSYPVNDLGTIAGRTISELEMRGEATRWSSFSVAEPGLVLIEAIARGNGDPVIRLWDDLGREVAFNDDFSRDNFNSQLAARLFSGTYLIALSDISNTDPVVQLVIERYQPVP